MQVSGDVTFTMQEFISALQLIRTQNDISAAHENDTGDSFPALRTGTECPLCYLRTHQHNCIVCAASVEGEDYVDIGSMTITDVGSVSEDAAPSATAPTNQASISQVLTSAPAVITPPEERWYAVTAGRAIGVIEGWHNAHPLVIGVAGSCFVRCSSQFSATVAFEQAENEGICRIIP
ncbi:hypothetical protein BJ138DRAFT_589259 [Hygrophoropsis aurantiaca]|uniref:Uncharacterized protein n=1 Tax=Hygrophoropsis aurantiaca TaxID=72124 RepID=A0ACB8A0P6_9AGAM|nr:hypothetical protein BJ138DRAFT_589259 [Hygrophoropsis aurantiaca]